VTSPLLIETTLARQKTLLLESATVPEVEMALPEAIQFSLSRLVSIWTDAVPEIRTWA
jgi:hypothetical protein